MIVNCLIYSQPSWSLATVTAVAFVRSDFIKHLNGKGVIVSPVAEGTSRKNRLGWLVAGLALLPAALAECGPRVPLGPQSSPNFWRPSV
jgi:hypothetical protein